MSAQHAPNPLPALRTRLSRLVLAGTLVWGLAMGGSMWWVLAQETDELLDETLQASAEVLGRLVVLPAALGSEQRLAGPNTQRYFAWQLVDASGANPVLLHRSANAPDTPLLPTPTLGFADAGRWRVYGSALPTVTDAPARHLYVAQTRDERDEAQREVAFSGMAVALVLGLLLAPWLHWRVVRELKPLEDLSQQLRGHDPTLGHGLPPAALAELAPVHDAIDELSERLRQRLANERAFSAHAAHALRTPLASIEAQLAVAQRDADASLAPRLVRVRQASARLARVVSALLALFRSGSELNRSTVALAPLLERLALDELQLQLDPQAHVFADEDLLAAVLLNLADNAMRHHAKQWRLTVQMCDAEQVLTLQDDGAGVPPARLPALQQALQTQDYSAAGLGLGLMLADLVARAHGGSVRLHAAMPGLVVELRLGLTPDSRPGTGA